MSVSCTFLRVLVLIISSSTKETGFVFRMRRKQSVFPVIMLTQGESERYSWYADPRTWSTHMAFDVAAHHKFLVTIIFLEKLIKFWNKVSETSVILYCVFMIRACARIQSNCCRIRTLWVKVRTGSWCCSVGAAILTRKKTWICANRSAWMASFMTGSKTSKISRSQSRFTLFVSFRLWLIFVSNPFYRVADFCKEKARKKEPEGIASAES